MGKLGLELSSSVAKLARARELLGSLDAKVAARLREERPYTLRVAHTAAPDGWFSVFMVPRDFAALRFGIAFGDVLHNLRCALDYIVTELLAASAGGQPSTEHQFPIFEKRGDYVARVEKPALKGRGPIGGVRHGTDLVEQLQPYHRADPGEDALWIIKRFCNADKHREIAAFVPMLGAGSLTLTNCRVIDSRPPSPLPLWRPGHEHCVAEVRLAPPYPSQVPAAGTYDVRYKATLLFGTSGIREEQRGQAITLTTLGHCCDHVARVLERFLQL